MIPSDECGVEVECIDTGMIRETITVDCSSDPNSECVNDACQCKDGFNLFPPTGTCGRYCYSIHPFMCLTHMCSVLILL